MMNFRIIRDGISIMQKFGLRHAFKRYRDLRLINKEDRKRSNLYDKVKPHGLVIKDILGNKMQLDMNDYGIHRDLFLDGIREPIATKHLKNVLSEEDVVLDIGANIGYYVLIESDLCKKVYAVEPVQRNIKYLKKNIELNRKENVEVYEIALGDVKGRKPMNISPRSNLHSFYPIDDVLKKEYIKMDTVDNFLKHKESPTFMRMDVEGYEIYILRGARKTLKKIQRVFIEIHSHIMTDEETKEVIDILKEEGFCPEKIIKYDKPGLSRILSNDYMNKIYQGDKGVYEVFWNKKHKSLKD